MFSSQAILFGHTIGLGDPNQSQEVPLGLIEPTEHNPRLFIERESLESLRDRYRPYAKGDRDVVLPDPPIVRYRGNNRRLELLAGERRITAASAEGVASLPVRVVSGMSDEEAYLFVMEHNNVAGLTTAELAFRAAQMERLGFSREFIGHHLGGVNPQRYLVVGAMLDADSFTDSPKLCDPPITEWYEAARFGPRHFARCFHHWNSGVWDAKTCSREFRRRGRAMPLDNAEKGLRISVDGDRLRVRGTLDLELLTQDEVARITSAFIRDLQHLVGKAVDEDDFGAKEILYYNPDSLAL